MKILHIVAAKPIGLANGIYHHIPLHPRNKPPTYNKSYNNTLDFTRVKVESVLKNVECQDCIDDPIAMTVLAIGSSIH